MMTNLHFQFSGLSLAYRLCIQSSTSKSRQNQFVTKITGESVLDNPIDLRVDLQMFQQTGCTWKRKMTYSRYVLKMER